MCKFMVPKFASKMATLRTGRIYLNGFLYFTIILQIISEYEARYTIWYIFFLIENITNSRIVFPEKDADNF